MTGGWVLLTAASVTSFVTTGLVRRYLLHRGILDVPSHRSSHLAPTPRGGGLAVALTLLCGVAIQTARGALPGRLAAILLFGGGAIALVGWLDDMKSLSRRVRLGFHSAAAAFAVLLLGGFPVIHLGTAELHVGLVGSLVAWLGIVWLTNLYNFMDGIDGIAPAEGALASGIGGAVLVSAGYWQLGFVSLVLTGATIGFLPWNWMPAKIFLGDVGSGFIGFVLGVLALASERAGALPVTLWIFLLATFIFDATVTLIRRFARGDRVTEAHRSHAYQRAVQSGLTHSTVTVSVLSLGLLCAAGAIAAVKTPRLFAPALIGILVLLTCAYLWVERRYPFRNSLATKTSSAELSSDALIANAPISSPITPTITKQCQ